MEEFKRDPIGTIISYFVFPICNIVIPVALFIHEEYLNSVLAFVGIILLRVLWEVLVPTICEFFKRLLDTFSIMKVEKWKVFIPVYNLCTLLKLNYERKGKLLFAVWLFTRLALLAVIFYSEVWGALEVCAALAVALGIVAVIIVKKSLVSASILMSIFFELYSLTPMLLLAHFLFGWLGQLIGTTIRVF
ncbi:MAG: hypothetical protein ACI4AB_07195 [Acetatifactor sp.]